MGLLESGVYELYFFSEIVGWALSLPFEAGVGVHEEVIGVDH